MIILLITFILGFVTGILLYRNNINKLKKTEKTGKSLFNLFK